MRHETISNVPLAYIERTHVEHFMLHTVVILMPEHINAECFVLDPVYNEMLVTNVLVRVPADV